MGRDKALLPWPPLLAGAPKDASGNTFLSAAIQSLTPSTEMVIVVAGANSAQIAPVIYAQAAFLVENPQPELGQFSSLRIGLHEVLSRGRDAAVVTLVDRPPVLTATLQALLAAFASAVEQGKWAVVPQHEGRNGHPIVIGREMIEAFLRAPDSSNAREVRHAHQEFIEYVAVDDPNVALNVDTPQEYSALQFPD